jgi:hypothetical protein
LILVFKPLATTHWFIQKLAVIVTPPLERLRGEYSIEIHRASVERDVELPTAFRGTLDLFNPWLALDFCATEKGADSPVGQMRASNVPTYMTVGSPVK